MSELKSCPFCGEIVKECNDVATPIDVALRKRIAELVADGIHIEWMNEDELPEEISDEVYSTMYACSVVDFVRFFPFVTIDGRKRFLIELPEREK